MRPPLALVALPALAVLAVLAVLACAGGRAARAEHAARCPESRAVACATEERCDLDEGRGCFVCTCSGARERAPAGVARPDAPPSPPPPTP